MSTLHDTTALISPIVKKSPRVSTQIWGFLILIRGRGTELGRGTAKAASAAANNAIVTTIPTNVVRLALTSSVGIGITARGRRIRALRRL